jgi:hypothetical protein
MADTKDTKAEQARQEKREATSPTRDDQPDPRPSTEVKPREAKAVGPSRIDDPARTEAGAGARVNLPEKEARRADRPPEGEETEPVPVGSPAAKGATYTYRVVERAFKENILLDPAHMPEDSRGLFQSQHVYNSRALEPADDATKAAVDELKDEHDQLRNKAAPISRDESTELRQRIAELEATLKGSRSTTAPAPAEDDEKGASARAEKGPKK